MKKYCDLLEDYFAEIDTAEKAYWLGFLMGDCGISKSGRSMSLLLSVKDEQQIIQFCQTIGINPKLRRRFPSYPEHNRGPSVGICISSAPFVNHLVSHGCVYKKSLILEYPDLLPPFHMPFVLGYYDADGWAGTTYLGSGSKTFLEQLKKKNGIASDVKWARTQWTLWLGTAYWRKMLKSYAGGLQRKRYLNTGAPSDEALFDPNWRAKKKGPQPYKRLFDPGPEELKKLVWEKPTTEVAKMFGVSDKAIEKRCKLLGISKPPRGYWQKK